MDDIIKFAFSPITEHFNAFEVQPCKLINEKDVEVCESGEEDFWSVYVHLSAGGVECIGDFVDQPTAEKFMDFLQSLIDMQEINNSLWNIEDFESQAQEREDGAVLYDRSKFGAALLRMIRKHNATVGITWETIDYYLDEYCKL